MQVHQITIDKKPMMSDAEINLVCKLIRELKPKNCLEWGSGASTLFFSKYPSIDLWLSIEHNGHYLDYLRDKAWSNIQTIWILEGDSYADCVQRSNRRFDFILIDGLDRIKCLENALDIVSENGIILLHDAGRSEYAEAIEEYGGEILLQGEKPEKNGGFAHRGLALFRRQDGTS